MKAFYDSKPSAMEAVGNGSYLYRWDIQEEEVQAMETDGAEQRTQWSCEEVTVWAPITADKVKDAVIRSLGGEDHELKLLNEHNSYLMGLSSSDNTEEYKSFLQKRSRIKGEVDEVLNAWNGVSVSEETVLAKAKAAKISEIYAYDSSGAVNRCYLNYGGSTIPYWASKSERNDLKTALKDCISAGIVDYRLDLRDVGVSVTVGCERLLAMMTELEVYAVKCFNKTTDHVFAVNAFESMDEVSAYDHTTGYPEVPTFELG